MQKTCLKTEKVFSSIFVLQPSLKIPAQIIHKLSHRRLLLCLLVHGHHHVPAADGIADGDQLHLWAWLFVPGPLGPEADARGRRRSGSEPTPWAVALEDHLGPDTGLMEKVIADLPQLPAVSQPDIPLLPKLPEVHRLRSPAVS